MMYFIVNPTASGGKAIAKWKEIEALLIRRNAEYECIFLEHENAAAQTAAALTSDHRPCTIVILGGDGTIDEVVNGMTTFEDVTLGVIPVGSGNDFARALRLPSKAEDCVELLLGEHELRPLNIGEVRSADERLYHRFAVSSGIGYDAAVCTACSISPVKSFLNRIGMGRLIYTVNALRMLARQKPDGMSIRIDDRPCVSYRRVYLAAAMNTAYEGGGVMFAPDASPADDRLDLIFFENIRKWKVLLILPLCYLGRHTRFRGVHLTRCQTVALSSRVPLYLHCDGEVLGQFTQITYSICPQKLSVIVRQNL